MPGKDTACPNCKSLSQEQNGDALLCRACGYFRIERYPAPHDDVVFEVGYVSNDNRAKP